MKFSIIIKNIDWQLLAPAIILTLLGLVAIFGNSSDSLSFKKQILFFGIAIVAMLVIASMEVRALKANSYLLLALYLGSLLLLLGLLIFGTQTRGVKGWYDFGFMSFDPKIFSALILILVLAKYFSLRHIEMASFWTIIVPAIYVLFPIVLILLEPDLGSSLGFIAIWFGIIMFSGLKTRHFFILILLTLIVFAGSWQVFLKDYQKQRILTFLNLQNDDRGIAWSVNQSKIAIGSAGIFGKGIGKGSQSRYGFLSEPNTDFIFSSLAEQTGLAGVFVVLATFLFLFFRIISIIFMASDNFTRLFSAGFAFFLLSQIFVNAGMCLGLFPVVGIPLPFVSYGGSQLLASYLGIGILMSLQRKE